MKMHCTTFIFGVILFKVSCGIQHYTDQWAVHLTGGERAAKDLALRHGFAYVSEVSLIQKDSIQFITSLFII